MSLIFAWNMRRFNMPHKQRVVSRWIKVAKLNIGCLVETRVHEGHFKKVEFMKVILRRWLRRHSGGGAIPTIMLIKGYEEYGFAGQTPWRLSMYPPAPK